MHMRERNEQTGIKRTKTLRTLAPEVGFNPGEVEAKGTVWRTFSTRVCSFFLLLGLTSCFQQPLCPDFESLSDPNSVTARGKSEPTFVVERTGNTYHATSKNPSKSYSGTLKLVVERTAKYLTKNRGGTISFGAGEFDLGPDWFELDYITDVTFVGRGVDVTVLQNNASAATDTEVFDCTACDRLTIQDMTVAAGGPLRSTSDALDFDGGDDILIERVKVTKSRGRGIVFDGKGEVARNVDTADRNVVRDCIVVGIPSDGVHLLASSHNLVEGCTIVDVGGTGIQINKGSSTADQPNKKSNDNIIRNNFIKNVGHDGIKINSGDRNLITGNTVLNSSDDVSSLDGIRITSYNAVSCNDNVIKFNTATDNQATKTQKYGLKITSVNCHRTVVKDNDFAGNLFGEMFDEGTNTVYASGPEPKAPSVPTNLTATAVGSLRVKLSWTASTSPSRIREYEVQRNGAYLATPGNVTSYSDTEVQPGTTYTYAVRARDAAGKWSHLSNSASAVTLSCRSQP